MLRHFSSVGLDMRKVSDKVRAVFHLTPLTSCFPWVERSILLALTCPSFCGRTAWRIGGRSPGMTKHASLLTTVEIDGLRLAISFLNPSVSRPCHNVFKATIVHSSLDFYGMVTSVGNIDSPSLTEASLCELVASGLYRRCVWWCLGKRPGWRPGSRLYPLMPC